MSSVPPPPLRTSADVRRWCVLVIATLVASSAASLAILARWEQEPPNHREQAIAALSDQTRVLALGTSHVFASLDPSHQSVPSMNLAAPVCSYVCMEGILLGNLPRVPRLELVLLELDVVSALYDTLAAYHGDYRQLLQLQPAILQMAISPFAKYELLRDSAILASPLAPAFGHHKLTPQEALDRVRGVDHAEDPIILPGYSNGPGSLPPEDDGAARVARHLRESPGLEQVQTNREALVRMGKELAKRNIRVVLVRFPHHASYYANQPASWELLLKQTAEALEPVLGSRPDVWDYSRWHSTRDQDFRNGDHLNAAASRQFSRMVSQRIAALISTDSAASPPGVAPGLGVEIVE